MQKCNWSYLALFLPLFHLYLMNNALMHFDSFSSRFTHPVPFKPILSSPQLFMKFLGKTDWLYV
jgi:hypothetical protein